jgi:outer membrane protein assembly factor BamB
LSGVGVDPQGLLSVVVDAGAAFDTQGKDISGDNFLVKVDPVRGQVLWRKNLTEVTNGVYGGYQDVAHDAHGNTFVVGTFPTSIVKVGPNGSTAIPWYLQPQPNQTVHGLTGLAANGEILLATDSSDGQLYRFNSTNGMGRKTHVPIKGNRTAGIGNDLDGIALPQCFNGTVLLVSDNTEGTIVLRSADGLWTSAEVLGTVPNMLLSQNGSTVDTVEIAGSLYSVNEFFLDDKVPGTLAGDRTQFPMIDITKEVLALLR